MKIGVISDTHGCATIWRHIMDNYFQDVDMIIHAGDILYHGPRNQIMEGYDPPLLAKLINESKIPIIFARGNCDADVDQMMIEWPIQSPYSLIQTGTLRILVNHSDNNEEDKILKLLGKYQTGLFIHGHTHIPRLEKLGDLIILNPGSCSLPKKGEPTIAFIEENEISIVNINENKKIKSLEI